MMGGITGLAPACPDVAVVVRPPGGYGVRRTPEMAGVRPVRCLSA